MLPSYPPALPFFLSPFRPSCYPASSSPLL
jgi:hypothetical protein